MDHARSFNGRKNYCSKKLNGIVIYIIGQIVDLPQEFVNRVNSMFFKFLWGGSEKVKRTTLIKDYDSGGLKMIHFNRSFLLIKMLKLTD